MARTTWFRAVRLGMLVLCGCAGSFRDVYPGMTRAQVADVMKTGPSRTEEFQDGFSAWYYGADRCLLIQGNEVVGKRETESRTVVNTPFGGVREKVTARCVPPGMETKDDGKVQVNTPAGRFEIPKQMPH